MRASERRLGNRRTRITFTGDVKFNAANKRRLCVGLVNITIKHRKRTVRRATVRLTRRCTFNATATVRTRRLNNDGGTVTARFRGNRLLLPASGGPALF